MVLGDTDKIWNDIGGREKKSRLIRTNCFKSGFQMWQLPENDRVANCDKQSSNPANEFHNELFLVARVRNPR